MNVDPIPLKQESRDYVQQELNTILIQALTQLAKEKPKDPVQWLATWLLNNNPNKPKITESITPMIIEEESDDDKE